MELESHLIVMHHQLELIPGKTVYLQGCMLLSEGTFSFRHSSRDFIKGFY